MVHIKMGSENKLKPINQVFGRFVSGDPRKLHENSTNKNVVTMGPTKNKRTPKCANDI